MSRKTRVLKRPKVQADPRFNSLLVSKFINAMMLDGKKNLARMTFYKAMEQVTEKTGEADPLEVFTQAIENIKPLVEVKSRRVGGANYQVPIEVRPERRQTLAIRWMLEASRNRGEKTMVDRLCNEVCDAFKKTGTSVKKREDTHRMAEANKAFAHYRW